MAGRCSPPKTVRVKDYERNAPKRKRKRAAKAAPSSSYWTCVNRSGRTCGTHHATMPAAVAHRKRLDRLARAARARNGGTLNDWHVEKR